jgi:hypothetical protein
VTINLFFASPVVGRIDIPPTAFPINWKKSSILISFERDGRFINSVKRPTSSTINRNLQKFRIKLAVSLRSRSSGGFQPKTVKMKIVITWNDKYKEESLSLYAMLPMHELALLGGKGTGDAGQEPNYTSIPLAVRKFDAAIGAFSTSRSQSGMSEYSTSRWGGSDVSATASPHSRPHDNPNAHSLDVSQEKGESALDALSLSAPTSTSRSAVSDLSLSFVESDVAEDECDFEAVIGAGMQIRIVSVTSEKASSPSAEHRQNNAQLKTGKEGAAPEASSAVDVSLSPSLCGSKDAESEISVNASDLSKELRAVLRDACEAELKEGYQDDAASKGEKSERTGMKGMKGSAVTHDDSGRMTSVPRAWYRLSVPVRCALVVIAFCCYVLMLPVCDLARQHALHGYRRRLIEVSEGSPVAPLSATLTKMDSSQDDRDSDGTPAISADDIQVADATHTPHPTHVAEQAETDGGADGGAGGEEGSEESLPPRDAESVGGLSGAAPADGEGPGDSAAPSSGECEDDDAVPIHINILREGAGIAEDDQDHVPMQSITPKQGQVELVELGEEEEPARYAVKVHRDDHSLHPVRVGRRIVEHAKNVFRK